jgi:hypothetical protein
MGSNGDIVAVGDLNSSARGTGARKNSGKPQWHQLPVFALDRLIQTYDADEFVYCPPSIAGVIKSMGYWQRSVTSAGRGRCYLDGAVRQMMYLLAKEAGMNPEQHIPLRALASTVRVLEFGAIKYKPGNWAKGMPWSVCFSCAMSHLFAAAGGEVDDNESGLSHLAHAMCNLLFLVSYDTLYPEGDDRIVEWAIDPPAPADLFINGRIS